MIVNVEGLLRTMLAYERADSVEKDRLQVLSGVGETITRTQYRQRMLTKALTWLEEGDPDD